MRQERSLSRWLGVESGAGNRQAVRVRWLAHGLLVGMAGLYLLSRHFAPLHPGWEWAKAFSEAAMVGALADWFAVTALFRHPMGLPIPHTAIIPAKKDQIAESMAGFLRANFLTPQVVARRLSGLDVAGALGGFLADPGEGGEPRLRQGAAGLLGDMLQSLPGEQLGDMLKSTVRGQLERLDLAPLLGQLLEGAMADGRHRGVIEAMLRWTGITLEANEDLLRKMIHDRAHTLLRWTGLDETLANTILDGLYKMLAECIVDPQHPLRTKLEDLLAGLAHDLRHDPAMQAKVARMKAEILANRAMGAWIDGLWERARGAAIEALSHPGGLLQGRMGAGLAGFGAGLQTDARLRHQVNRFARRSLAGLAVRHGAGIVKLVSDTVRRWDARTVSERIEGAVGRDLQFIRINGTLVGGIVGLLLHSIEKLL
ncbi:uncharacterized membrane-anchored protein YjiN (DUF445 family) [Novosphingobium sediminicola]|uniref:Uncharacterized membrane-anchored protein YjiN (DUF445 family) n=2 Tax=Novosphingobium sediminicola TaxID=563162 RepID=A0A7W6CN34_9SPHN|nr:uncharacterized membrane-anchored protein YjiN (DUF445 family) [Novosphingobium sediminicola]